MQIGVVVYIALFVFFLSTNRLCSNTHSSFQSIMLTVLSLMSYIANDVVLTNWQRSSAIYHSVSLSLILSSLVVLQYHIRKTIK